MLNLKLAALLMAVIACGQQSAPPAVDVTGMWLGDFGSNTGPPGYTPIAEGIMTLQLTQSGAGVSGSFRDASRTGTVAGSVSAHHVQLRIAVAPCGGPANQPGTFVLAGTVADTTVGTQTMVFDYQGTACGVAEYGSGTLIRL